MKYIAYAAAAIIGLFMRTIAAYSIGWTTYRMDGHDILMAIFGIVIVWCVRGMFMPATKKPRNRSDKNDR